MAITVRELVTKLTIGGNASDKLAKFGLAVNGVKAGLDIMVGAVKAASAATLGLVDDVTKVGDEIAKTSRKAGVSAKEFQRLGFSAERSGASMRSLRKGLQNIERNLRDASLAAGKGKSTGFSLALNEVGLRLKDLEGLDAEGKLGLIGDALSSVADQGRKVALSQKLIGERSGPELASLLAEGTSGIKALGDEAERLGLVMDDDALGASEAFQDSMTNLKSVIQGIKTTIGVALIPIVKRSVDGFRDWLLANREFIKLNFEKFVRKLSKAIASLLKHSDRIVATFEDLVRVGDSVLSFFMELTKAVGGVGNALTIAGAAWGTYRTLAMAATLGFSLTPIGMLATALLAVGAAFLVIETNAEKARLARFRFESGDGAAEEKPVNEEEVERDANEIARRIRSGRRLGVFVKSRLVETSREQVGKTFNRAEHLIKQGRGRLKVGGSMRRVSGRGGQPGELDLLNEFVAQVRKERESDRVARENSFKSPPSGDVFDELGIKLSPDVPSFKPFKEDDSAKKEKDSLSDLLAAAIKSGSLPESAALLASSQPPIIIPITNNNVEVNVDATSSFEGVPGENAAAFAERAESSFKELWTEAMRSTIGQIRPQLAR
jgi:hypothetical protein